MGELTSFSFVYFSLLTLLRDEEGKNHEGDEDRDEDKEGTTGIWAGTEENDGALTMPPLSSFFT